jgi:hypothetical protein
VGARGGSAGSQFCTDAGLVAAGPDGGPCSECSGGRYKATNGSNACQLCDDSAPTDDRTWCRCLDPHALFLEHRCVCAPGYTQAADSGEGASQCTPCAPKTFKESAGNGACAACPAYSTSEVVGSTSWEDCQCNAGYTLMATVCRACPAGKHKERLGALACTLCVEGTYSTAEAASAPSTCLPCPPRSNSPTGSPDLGACACGSLPRCHPDA